MSVFIEFSRFFRTYLCAKFEYFTDKILNTKSNDKGVSVDLKAVSADTKASKKYVAKVIESMLYDCYEFEKLLTGRDDYFDLTQSCEFDLSTIPRGSIIKVDAFLEVPENFD
ncbi:MAG: hypothetical protein Q4D71_14710, partial [Oscillospiraceae bacterium]|nr:hypothetical protein [Oscillospiraceae bacterium]